MKSLALGLSVLIAVALLAGCGGGGHSSETITTSSLSKSQFLKRAQAICIKGTGPILPGLTAYEEKHKEPTDRGNERVFGEAIKRVIPPALRAQADRIRALGAPAGDEAQVEAFLVALERDASEIKNGPALSSPTELDAQFRRSGKLATGYGLTACAYG